MKKYIVTVEIFDGDLYTKKISINAKNDAHAYELAYNIIGADAERKCYDFSIIHIK